MLHDFELHEFFHSPKNVHLKALLLYDQQLRSFFEFRIPVQGSSKQKNSTMQAYPITSFLSCVYYLISSQEMTIIFSRHTKSPRLSSIIITRCCCFCHLVAAAAWELCKQLSQIIPNLHQERNGWRFLGARLHSSVEL